MQNSPNKIKDKKTFHLSSTLSAEKYHSNPNKILRHSESFCYRKEGIHLEKSIKKLTLSDRETTLFCPGEVSPKIESTSFNTPIKQNKQTFNERLMESDKHPSSNYLILNIDKKEDEISVLVKILVFLIFKEFLKFEKELKIINHFIEYFNERNQELLKFFVYKYF